MEQKIYNKLNRLNEELGKLTLGNVIEAKDLTKEEVNFFREMYKKDYLIRGPIEEQKNKYVLSFELNSDKIRGR